MADEPSDIIKTSDTGWMERLALAYRERAPVVVIDDAGAGIDPARQTVFEMARMVSLSPREMAAVAVALGMGGAGVLMIVLAFLDPEPTSKLGLLVGGGAVCVFTGGLTAIRILVSHKPPRVRVDAGHIARFEISWD
ncbi:MAG TPA: hypothetical protein VFG59_19465 [Anaeromyxobacter sp.]|nr:hypothetical protein [Anaeromyxobacter sp.]